MLCKLCTGPGFCAPYVGLSLAVRLSAPRGWLKTESSWIGSEMTVSLVLVSEEAFGVGSHCGTTCFWSSSCFCTVLDLCLVCKVLDLDLVCGTVPAELVDFGDSC
jgi:hypothetical protein